MLAQDEEKIISSIHKEDLKNLRDYATLARLENEYRYKNQQRRLRILTVFAAFYSLLSVMVLLWFKNRPNILFWPINIESQSQEVENLRRDIESVKQETTILKSAISSSTGRDIPINYLNLQLDRLDNREKALEESISLDPEKALTAGLLREKQKNLEANLLELRGAHSKIDSKLDNFITTVLIAPIVTAIFGFLIWLLQKKMKKED